LTGQNRLALEELAKGPVASPFSCPFVSPSEGSGDVTENIELIQAQKIINPRYLQAFTELISLLRSHPDIVALCISTYEKEKNHLVRPPGLPAISVGDILQSVLDIYGKNLFNFKIIVHLQCHVYFLLGGIGGPLTEDGILLLKLLSALAGYQVYQALKHG